MKTLLNLIFSILFLNSAAKAQIPTNLVFLTTPVQANVCDGTVFSVKFNATNSFTLDINAVIRLGSATGPVVSANPYPNCANQVPGNNPVVIEITNITTNPAFGMFTPTLPPTLNQSTYSWVLTHNDAPSVIEVTIEYVIKLDCSLIPQGSGTNPNQALFLVQTWGPFNTNNEIITPVGYPYITSLFSVDVQGNYGQQSDMIFEFANIGSAPVTMDFEFEDLFLQNCGATPVYELIAYAPPVQFEVIPSGSTQGAFNLTYASGTFANQSIIPPGSSLYIRQRVNILDCYTSCSSPKEIQFKWQCSNADQPPACDECQKSYITPFNFTIEQPSYEIRLLNPQPPLYSNICPGESVPYTVEIENTSQFTSLLNLNLAFDKGVLEPMGLVNIYEPSVFITQQCTTCATCTACAAILNPVATGPGNLCPASDPLASFDININEIKAGQKVKFLFSTTFCDQYNNQELVLLDVDKFFNQWGVTPTCTTKCGDLLEPTVNHLQVNGPGTNGISTHSSNAPGTDMNLGVNFSHAGSSDFTVSIPACVPPSSCPGPFFGPVTFPQHMNLNGLFGNDDDMQVLGYQGGVTPITGILRAVIHCDQGLIADPTFAVNITRAGQLPWPTISNSFHQSIVSGTCLEGDYFYYFDLSGVSNPIDFINNSNFNFQLQSCCPILLSPQNYKVTFSILLNEDCYVFNAGNGAAPICSTTTATPTGCPWLPLSQRGFYVNVHCPGCRAPGIIVDEYRLQRTSYGYQDANNNRIADVNGSGAVIPIQPGSPGFNQINRDRSIHGDALEDRLVAHFEPGSTSLVDDILYPSPPNFYHGYTYTGDMSAGAGMNLGVLQLRRSIDHSKVSVMNVDPVSVDLYIDDPASVSGLPYLDGPGFVNYFFSSFVPFNAPTVVHQYYDANTSPSLSTILSRLDDEYLYTFLEGDFSGFVGFLPGQQYRMVVRYKVCGNSFDPTIPVGDPDNLVLPAGIENEMWLTGGGPSFPNGFILGNGLANHSSHPPMPNVVQSPNGSMPDMVTDHNLIFPIMNWAGSMYNDATQQNFADHFKFYCETFGGSHTFFSTDITNSTVYRSIDGQVNCGKTITVSMENTIGRKGKNYDVFPYEFRPPALFPLSISVGIPAGYNLSSTAKIFSKYWNYNGALTSMLNSQDFNFTVPTNINPLIIGHTNIGTTTLSNLACVNEGGIPNQLLMGDEQSLQVVELTLEPTCNAPVGLTYYLPNNSKVGFSENTVGCSTNTIACGYYDEQDDMDGPNGFYYPQPNLEAIFIQTGPVATPELCWDFTFTNLPNINAPNATSLPNLFLAVPALTNPGSNYLTGWVITDFFYNSIPQPTPFPAVNNGIFPLVDELAHDQYAIISGKVCANYTPCQGQSTFDFQWGWKCSGYPLSASDPYLCDIESTTITLVDEDVNVVINPDYTDWSPDFTLCDNSTFITGSFKSMEPGNVKPLTAVISIANANQIQIDNVWIINSCDPLSPQISAGTILPNVPFTIDITNSILNYADVINNPDGYLQQTDCISIRVEFTPLCHFKNPWQLPSIEMEFESYCNNPVTDPFTVVATFPAIPSSGLSTCVDCFSIEKTANPYTVAEGTELFEFQVEVCSNNILGIPVTVEIDDLLPNNFVPGPINEIGSGTSVDLDGIQCVPLIINGYIGTSPCNEAFMEYTNAQSVVVTLSDTACLTILPNCLGGGSIQIHAGDFSSQIGNSIGNIGGPPTMVSIAGDFYINNKFSFINCDVKIEPKAEIVIVNSIGRLTIDNSALNACSKMWKGITVEASTILQSLNNSVISGAQYAVQAKHRSTIILKNTVFLNNFVGLYIPLTTPFVYTGVAHIISECTFISSGALPIGYNNQAPSPGLIGYAGILANRTKLNLFQNTLQPNLFENLSNGVIGYQADMEIENCKFVNIQADIKYNGSITQALSGNSFNGSAIYGHGIGTNFGIRQTGLGRNTTNPYAFLNCNFGIYAERIDVTSVQNRIGGTTMNRSHRIDFGNGKNIHIMESSIETNLTAIDLRFNDGSLATVVSENDITFGDNSLMADYAGISVQEGSLINSNARIHNNDIYFRPGAFSARYGIITRATNGFEVTQNNISGADNINTWDGIYMDGCRDNIVSCNIISAIGNMSDPDDKSAIKYMMGDSPEIACNNLDNTPNGIFIIGPVLTTQLLRIEGNEFHNHHIGLRYGENTMTNNQDLMGNLWFNAAPSGGWQAKHEMGVNLNTFFYFNYVNLNNPLPPGGSTDFPLSDPTNWFKPYLPATPINFSCHTPTVNFFCNTNYPVGDINLSSMDAAIAVDSIENNPYTDETRWMLKMGLYAKLDNNPDLLSDTVMAGFYAEMQNTLISQMKAIDDEKIILFDHDSSFNVALVQDKLNREQTFDLMQFQVTSLNTAITNGDSIFGMLVIIDSLITELLNSSAYSDSMVVSMDNLRVVNADLINGSNSQLVATTTIESNEQIVNGIFLATVAKDNFAFTALHISILTSIASQCPLAGGNAVFRARALLMLAGGKLYYDDRTICGNVGIALRQQSGNEKRRMIAKIYPNPTDEKATLEYEIDELVTGRLRLFTATGKLLLQKPLAGGKGTYVFDTAHLNPGVYYYEVSSKGVSLHNGKLVIIR